MRFVGKSAAAGIFGLSLGFASPALADDYWAGPYVGPMYGVGWGDATYLFNTDGWYNLAPGDTFTRPVAGRPIGGVLGYNWRRGNLVYGFEYSIYTAILGVSHWNVPSPYFPARDEFDLKGHWFVTLNPRIGVAAGRLLAYVQAGPALGHLVAQVDDNVNGLYVWTPRAVLGLSAGAGVALALTHRVSIGVGYQFMTLRPLVVSGQSLDQVTGLPAGPATATDHTIQYRSHTVLAHFNLRLGPLDEEGVLDRGQPILDWTGPYAGVVAGALHQAGIAGGYNFGLGGNAIAGVEATATVDFCCGVDFEADLNARLGYILDDDLLLYAKGGFGYLWGTFFGVLDGLFYTLGGGVELAFSRHVSGYMELKAVGAFGRGLIDANFQGGLNWHFN